MKVRGGSTATYRLSEARSDTVIMRSRPSQVGQGMRRGVSRGGGVASLALALALGVVLVLAAGAPRGSHAFIVPPAPLARAGRAQHLGCASAGSDTSTSTSSEVRVALGKGSESANEEAVRLEDRNVPQAHAGLHDFLYGNEEDHGASSRGAESTVAEIFDGEALSDVNTWVAGYGTKKLAGVYSVIGEDGTVNFVGVSRHVGLAVQCHQKNEAPNLVHKLRVRSFKFPKRQEMTALQQQWIQECATTPVGNMQGSEWAQTIKDAAGAFKGDGYVDEYEASKLKMRKAMADPALADELDAQDAQGAERRRQLEQSVEGDDWSSVIDGQTSQTIAPKPTSPVPQTSSSSSSQTLEFTVENVDKVLDEVRPYLISDGGNCRVASIDPVTRSVSLVLMGACGTCPSSTTTMRMGIERVLRENFESIGEVRQVDDPTMSALSDVTVDIVEGILEPVRPAIKAMGGRVEVVSCLDGMVTLAYEGSPKIKYGIELACKDNPLVRDIAFVDF